MSVPRRLLVNPWLRPLLASLLVTALMLVTTWVAAQVGMALEGSPAPNGMRFTKLENGLRTVTLIILPILFVALRLDAFGHIRRLRLKLFAALMVGQIAAFGSAIYVA